MNTRTGTETGRRIDPSLIFQYVAKLNDAIVRDNVSGTNFAQTYAGTNRTRITSAGLQAAVGANTPVIDHLGTSLEPYLRLEPAGMNLLFADDTFTEAAGWTFTDSPTTAKNQTGITGVANTATTLTDANAAAYSLIDRVITKGAADTSAYMSICFFKKTVGATVFPALYLAFEGTAFTTAIAILNTNTGAANLVSVGSDATNRAVSVETIGDRFRVAVSGQDGNLNTQVMFRIIPAFSDDGTTLGAVSLTNSVIIEKAMLTTGTIPSSYFAGAAAIGSELVTGGAFTAHTSGGATLANKKISAVNGTAFVDFSAADVLTDHLGKILTLKDSTGKVLVGYIKAAGTGETSGTDIFDSFDFTAGWQTTDATISDANTFVTTAAGGRVWANLFVSLGLYKSTLSTAETGGTTQLNDGNNVKILLDGESNVYSTPTSNQVRLTNNTNTVTVDVTTMTAEQILTPAATGVTIVSTPGGATYNWAYKEAGFNYNDAGNYTYEIYDADFEYGTGWYPSSNTAVKIAGTASNLTQVATAAEASHVYRVGHTAVRTAGTLTPEFGSTDGAVVSANGTYYDYPIAADTDYIKFKADSSFAGSVDTVTIMEHGTVRLSEANTTTLAIPAAVTAAIETNGVGTVVVKGRFAFARAAGVVTNVISSEAATASLIYTTTAAGNITTNDGTTIAENTGAYTANTDWKIAVKFPSDTDEYMIGIDVAGAGIVWGTAAAFDGAINATANLILGYVLHGSTWIKYIKIFNKVLTDAQINAMN